VGAHGMLYMRAIIRWASTYEDGIYKLWGYILYACGLFYIYHAYELIKITKYFFNIISILLQLCIKF
jgi:hypothetical protein